MGRRHKMAANRRNIACESNNFNLRHIKRIALVAALWERQFAGVGPTPHYVRLTGAKTQRNADDILERIKAREVS